MTAPEGYGDKLRTSLGGKAEHLGMSLAVVPGQRFAEGAGPMFTLITFFTGLVAVRGFAGDDYGQALVEDAARQALSNWDERVSHHDVVAEFG